MAERLLRSSWTTYIAAPHSVRFAIAGVVFLVSNLLVALVPFAAERPGFGAVFRHFLGLVAEGECELDWKARCAGSEAMFRELVRLFDRYRQHFGPCLSRRDVGNQRYHEGR